MEKGREVNQSLKLAEIPSAILEVLNGELLEDNEFEVAGQAGSGRQYFRLPLKSEESKILMKSPEIDEDFERLLYIKVKGNKLIHILF